MNSMQINKNEFIGDPNQLISYREGVMTDGTSAGVRFMEVANGGNLSAVILPDRCMDIYQVRFRGKNMNYLAPSGIRAPQFYDTEGQASFLRNFFVGQMTTGGLQNIGAAKEAYGEMEGLHGHIDNTPAENVRYERKNVDGIPELTICGTMREARIFGANLSLRRELRFVYEEDRIELTDTVTNNSFGERQFVMLYHLNYGYPMLQEGTRIIIDSEEVRPRTEEAAKYLDSWSMIEGPRYPYPERCYYHRVKKDKDGNCSYTVFNDNLRVGVNVKYSGDDLPWLCEWKMLGSGEYVLGMEPMNTFMDGPAPGNEGCKAPNLLPGESRTYRLALHYIDKLLE